MFSTGLVDQDAALTIKEKNGTVELRAEDSDTGERLFIIPFSPNKARGIALNLLTMSDKAEEKEKEKK